MVRTIDGEQRRRLLAETVWRVIRRDGFEAASVRGVAAEAGLSMGSVRHFFGSQAELHRFAMQQLNDTVAQRVQAALAAGGDDPVAAVVAGVRELLPYSTQTREEFLAHLQFLTRAGVDPRLAAVARESYDAIDGMLLRLLGDLKQLGLVREEIDVTEGARRLGVLVDGLFLRMLVTPDAWSAEQADHAVEEFLIDLGPHA